MLLYILIFIVLAFAAYVRLVPLSAERFHTSISATNNKDIKGASIQIVQNTAGAMEKLDASLKAPVTRSKCLRAYDLAVKTWASTLRDCGS